MIKTDFHGCLEFPSCKKHADFTKECLTEQRLQLWNKEGRVVRREGDPLEVAQWLQACHNAGMEVRVQVNESVAPQINSALKFLFSLWHLCCSEVSISPLFR
ncbi:hypothetical protein K3392_25710 (plasmid) [Escherichia coli]|nr:hypothetical protein K3392_25710 [Escherichia coli]